MNGPILTFTDCLNGLPNVIFTTVSGHTVKIFIPHTAYKYQQLRTCTHIHHHEAKQPNRPNIAGQSAVAPTTCALKINKANLLSRTGPLLSFVTVFFSFIPLWMSPSRAPRPFSSFLLSLGFSVLAIEKVGGGGAAGGGGGGGGIFEAGGQRERNRGPARKYRKNTRKTDLYQHNVTHTFSPPYEPLTRLKGTTVH